MCILSCSLFFFQAEDGIRDLVRSRGLGDVYKRQGCGRLLRPADAAAGLRLLPSQRGGSMSKRKKKTGAAARMLSLIHI